MNERPKYDYREAPTPELLDYFSWLIDKAEKYLSLLKTQELSIEEKDSFKSYIRCAFTTLLYLENERNLTVEEAEKLEKIRQRFADCLEKESGQIVGLKQAVDNALSIIGFDAVEYQEEDVVLFCIEPGEMEKVLGYDLGPLEKEVFGFFVFVDESSELISMFFGFGGFGNKNKSEYLVSKVITEINGKHEWNLGCYYSSQVLEHRHLEYSFQYNYFAGRAFSLNRFLTAMLRLTLEFIDEDAKDFFRIKRAALGIIDKTEEYAILKNLAQIVHDHDDR